MPTFSYDTIGDASTMMTEYTALASVLSDGDSALFVTEDHPQVLLEGFVARGHRELVIVTPGECDEALVEGIRSVGPDVYVIVLAVGAETRSTSGSVVRSAPRPAIGPADVRPVSADHVDRLERHVDDALGASRGSPDTAVYVHDVDGLLSTAGVGSAYERLAELAGWSRPSGPAVYASFAGPVREATVAGLAPIFDAVVEVHGGEAAPLEVRPGDGVGLEQAFDLLKPRRRRTLLRALDDAGGAIRLDGLAKAVGDRLAVDPDRLQVTLYQTDLPKLEAAGVVAVGPDDETVALRPAAVRLWPLLSTTASED